MVLKRIREKVERVSARAKGMTVPEYRRYKQKRKEEKRKFKERLRRAEQKEREKFEIWKVKQKYKEMRKQRKKQPSGSLSFFGLGQPSTSDPFGLFGAPQTKTKRKRKRKRKTKKRKMIVVYE